MKRTKWLVLSLLILLCVSPLSIHAQETPAPIPQPSARAVILSDGENGLQIGEIALPGNSLAVDFAVDMRHARVDDFGLLRFVPKGGGEGVYTFSPYFSGFTTGSLEENKLRVAEAAWSPNGEMLAFRIASGAPESNDGVWFWQPAIEIATDPSYHILRDCPPGCGLVTQQNAKEWRSTSLEWSSDNANILVGLMLPQEENRGAFTVRVAARDPQTGQSRVGPLVARYDYAHWATDGQRIIVSGTDADSSVVFGSVSIDGTLNLTTHASDIGMVWVQDAIQQPETGQIIMFGSAESKNGPLALIDNSGQMLSVPIGNNAPDFIEWNTARTAALVIVREQAYVVQVDGTVTDITTLAGNTPLIRWADGGFSSAVNVLPLPEPVATVQDIPGAEPTPSAFVIGQLLEVKVPALPIYKEASESSGVIAVIEVGEALIITDGPVERSGIVWWKVQTLDDTGWVRAELDGVPTIGDPSEPTG